MLRRRWLLWLGLTTLLMVADAHCDERTAVRLRLAGDRISVQSEDAPLTMILDQFRLWGVSVDFTPDHDPRLTLRMVGVDAETALGAILEGYDYVLHWRVVPGPLGALPALSAIRVLDRGAGSVVRYSGARAATMARLPVVDVPGMPGALMVRDELLLRVKPGGSIEDLTRLLDQVNGGVVDGCALVGAYRIRLRPYTNIPALADQLARHPLVDAVEPHWAWRPPRERDLKQIGTPAGSHALLDGGEALVSAPPGLALLDTGISEHAAWRDSMPAVIDLIYADGVGRDTDGHGTRMAALAAGYIRPLGMADIVGRGESVPGVLSMKVFDDQGVAPLFAVLRGVEQAIENRAGVISLSWGGPQNSIFLEDALVRARHNGIITLAAAGNEPTGQPVYPAASPAVLAVGALRPDGQPWEQSNFGPFVALAAPAFAVNRDSDETAAEFAGTSVATAYAAGILARYNAMHPQRSAEDNLTRFLDALTPPAGTQVFPNAGLLDADALGRLFGQ